jgi:ureidoglycolate lyase
VTERTHYVTAEPLTPEAFAPYGQVIGAEQVLLEVRGQEELTLDVLHYERRPFVIDHLNRHHHASQALVPLNGRPACIVVGAKELTFQTEADLDQLRAFILDGSRGMNLAIGTWHEGPWPLLEDLDLVNVQGRHVLENDNEVAHIGRELGVVVGVRL